MPRAPASTSNPSTPSVTDAVAIGRAGSVISIIWMPSSVNDATRAYVPAPIATVAISDALSSSSNPFTPSVTDAVAIGRAGSVISIIWMPSSAYDATRTYILVPTVTVAVPHAPSSSSNPPSPSAADATADRPGGSDVANAPPGSPASIRADASSRQVFTVMICMASPARRIPRSCQH